MALSVDIDNHSGFCAGVIRAIERAEKQLDISAKLYSLGAIVHNDSELSRLEAKGMVTIDKEDLEDIKDAQGEVLLIRAHGEPPKTYAMARERGFEVIDCTCPVVLRLQKSILEASERMGKNSGQILIFGKKGHAEVLGLLGQVNGEAFVIEDMQSLEEGIESGTVRLDSPMEIFSQTTKSPEEYKAICSRLENLIKEKNGFVSIPEGFFSVHDTICSQVASRHSVLSSFALSHDIIIFVSGKSSSNGKVLCELCKSLNIRTYHIDSAEELCREWFREDDSVGVCGATSTPKWLLEKVAREIEKINNI